MIFRMDNLFRLLCKSLGILSFVCLAGSELFAFPFIGIRINNGEHYTREREVTIEIKSLKLDEKLIESMQVGTSPDSEKKDWLNYSTQPFTFKLPAGDGKKTLYVRLKDKNGNISPTETASIILDTTPPKAQKILINGGAAYTNNKQMKVLLGLMAEGASKMQVSNQPKFDEAEWEAYKTRKSWLLAPPGDGKKTVYARFTDQAENISDVIQASIILDTKAPDSCEIIINENDKFTTRNKVQVDVKASGASKVRLLDRAGQEKILDLKNKNYSSIEWILNDEPGLKIIRAYFMDEAQNFTSQTIQDDIIFDPIAPLPPLIRINNGKTHTNHPEGIVDLHITSKENPAGFKILIGNTKVPGPEQIINFQPLMAKWKLQQAEDGIKYVYARLQDEAGNISEPAQASIILDRTPPVVEKIIINDGEKVTNNSKVSIRVEARGADFMQIGVSSNITKSNNWQPFISDIQSFQLPVGDGIKKLYFIFKDQAGNVSELANASIKLDESAPKGLFAFTEKQQYSNQRAIEVKFKTGDASWYQISHLSDFKNVSWKAVKDSIAFYQLPDEDGRYTLFFRLKDAVGNVSKPISLPVILDREKPEQVAININNGAEWFNRIDMKVTLSLHASGADEVMISNTPEFSQSRWQELERTMGWILDGSSDGIKTVYAQFRDWAGNISEVASAKIKVDTRGPSINNFEINRGATYTNELSRKVNIVVDAEGADSLYLSNEPIDLKAELEWIPYQDSLEWTLMDQDGVLTVFGLLKDKAGNVSQTFNDHIILDRVPPDFARVFINNNARFTNKTNVQVRLIAREAVKMKVSNYPIRDSVKWQPYQNLMESWTLDSMTEGRKIVYAWFMDKAGNVSDAIADDIILDRMAPDDITVAYRNDSASANEAWIVIRATDPKTMQWSFNENWEEANWQKYEPEFKIKLPAEKNKLNFFIRFRDEAENITQVFSKLITKPEDNDKQENKNE